MGYISGCLWGCYEKTSALLFDKSRQFAASWLWGVGKQLLKVGCLAMIPTGVGALALDEEKVRYLVEEAKAIVAIRLGEERCDFNAIAHVFGRIWEQNEMAYSLSGKEAFMQAAKCFFKEGLCKCSLDIEQFSEHLPKLMPLLYGAIEKGSATFMEIFKEDAYLWIPFILACAFILWIYHDGVVRRGH